MQPLARVTRANHTHQRLRVKSSPQKSHKSYLSKSNSMSPVRIPSSPSVGPAKVNNLSPQRQMLALKSVPISFPDDELCDIDETESQEGAVHQKVTELNHSLMNKTKY